MLAEIECSCFKPIVYRQWVGWPDMTQTDRVWRYRKA